MVVSVPPASKALRLPVAIERVGRERASGEFDTGQSIPIIEHLRPSAAAKIRFGPTAGCIASIGVHDALVLKRGEPVRTVKRDNYRIGPCRDLTRVLAVGSYRNAALLPLVRSVLPAVLPAQGRYLLRSAAAPVRWSCPSAEPW
jgi:hypothetical protein